MGLNLFELLMMIMMLAFLPDRVIRDQLRGGAALPKATLAFDPAAPGGARAAALAVAADTEGQVVLAPARGGPALTDAGGAAHAGPPAVTALFRSLRLLAPLALVLWIPGVRGRLARWLFPTLR
jgi:hypothetical protein